MNRRTSQGVPKGGYGSLACAPVRRRSRSRSRSPPSSASSSSARTRSTRSSREHARRRRRRRRRRSRSVSSSSSDSSSSSSSSGSRGSSRRRSSNHSNSRHSRGLPMGSPSFGKHGGLGGGGHVPMMGMGMGMGMGMAMGGVGMGVGGGGGGKDYASMASMASMASAPKDAYPMRNPMMPGGRGGFISPSLHVNGAITRPPPAVGGGKDYASLASGVGVAPRGGCAGPGAVDNRRGGVGGGGLYVDQARDGRQAGRVQGAAMSGRPSESSTRGAGVPGRFERLATTKAPPSPPGRDQFGRERDWRATTPNGRRAAASPSNGQVVHGSGFGTFSMTPSMSLGISGGAMPNAAATSKARSSTPSHSTNTRDRDSRSPAEGARGGAAPLTRADLVRQHSRRQQQDERQQGNTDQRQRLTPEHRDQAVPDGDQRGSGSNTPNDERSDRKDNQPRDQQKQQLSVLSRDSNNSDRMHTAGSTALPAAPAKGEDQKPEQSSGGREERRGTTGGNASDGNNSKSSPFHSAADGNNGAPPRSQSPSLRHTGTLNGSSNSSAKAGGSVAGALAGLASTKDRHRGGDGGSKSPCRRAGTTNGGGGVVNGGPPVERERDRPRPYPRLGLGQGLLARSTSAAPVGGGDADRGTSSQNGGGGGREGDSGRRSGGEGGGERGSKGTSGVRSSTGEAGARERDAADGGRGWKRDGYRGGDLHRLPVNERNGAGGSAGGSYRGNGGSGNGSGGIPSGRGVVRERDRPDSPRDRGRYNPTPPQPPPLVGPSDQQHGSGTLSVSARRASLGYHSGGRGNDWQDNGPNGSVSGGVGGGHKRPRSPEGVGMDLEDSDPPSPPLVRDQESKQSDARGTDSNRPGNHAVHRGPGRDGRSTPPGDQRYGTESGGNHRQPLPPPRSNGAGGVRTGASSQQHPRQSHRHNHPQSTGEGGQFVGRVGRSLSHPAMHLERGGGSSRSGVSSNARASPLSATGQGTPGRGSPLVPKGSPVQGSPLPASAGSPLGVGSRASPGTGDAGWGSGYLGADGGEGVGGESNGWGGGGRRVRAPVITDRLVSLKAEFLELHDMLLESDFQWEESQRYREVLQRQLDQLMLVPHRHRDSLPPPR